MKPIGLVTDPRFEDHLTGPGHPERPERLARVRSSLVRRGLAARCESVPPQIADDALLGLVHDVEHVRRVEAACRAGEGIVDSMDTAVCPDSASIARLATGSVVSLCRGVSRGEWSAGSPPSARRVTMPSETWPWGSACSTASPLRHGH